MYLFSPKKKYDPQPYNWFKHQWHKIVGCPVQQITIQEDGEGKLHLYCKCGVSHGYNVNKKKFLRNCIRNK